MDPEELFQLAEESVQGIGRIRDIKLGMTLICKEIREICPKAPVCRTYPFVRVVKMFPVLVEGLLGEKVLPFHMPLIKESFEVLLLRVGENLSKCGKFPPCLKFRFQREIPPQYLSLVKMAHLDGNVGKDLSHALSAVEDHGFDSEALSFQFDSRVPIYRRILSLHEPEEDVSFQPWRTEDEDAVPSREVGDIGDEDERLRRNGTSVRHGFVEVSSDRLDIGSECPCQLRKRLLAPDVFFPKIQMSALGLFHALKLLPTAYAFIPLDTSPLPILLRLGRTRWAVFFCASYSMVLS